MLAAHQGTTESTLLKRMVELSIQAVTPQPATLLSNPHTTQSRQRRMTVRLRSDAQRLLIERAAARNVAPATYVSLVMHTHLFGAAPLPEEELKALKSSLRELAVTRRYAQALVQMARRDGKLTGPHSQEVVVMVKVLDAMHTKVKALLAANLKSWETRYGQ